MLLIDIIAFFGINIAIGSAQAIVKTAIFIFYWLFNLILILLILTAFNKFSKKDSRRTQKFISTVFALTIVSFLPKLFFSLFITLGFLGENIVNIFSFALPFSTPGIVVFTAQAGLIGGAVILLVMLEGVLYGRYRYSVNRLSISFDHLNPAFDGFKVVQISDLHLGSFHGNTKPVAKAVRKINALNPDIICFTGDMVNNLASETIGWKETLGKLSAQYGKYSILGNHDYGDYSSWDSYELKLKNLQQLKQFHQKIGFDLLLNDARHIEKGNEKIAVVGVENWGLPPFKKYGKLDESIEPVKDTHFKILLSHDPSHWNEEVAAHTDIALTLSGHTHGAQFGIKIGKFKWSPVKYKYRYWKGLYKRANQYLYVNIGLGFLSFPGRIGMPPEITLIELKSNNLEDKSE